MTFVRLYQAHHHIDSSGFACTVWTKQPYNFTLLYINGNMIYYRSAAVGFHEVVGIDDA
jgi:hypothetical protein